MGNKFVEGAVTGTVLVAGVVGVLWWFGLISFMQDGDDRPPVVVSSGSINIDSEADTAGEYGKPARVDPRNNRIWRFTHTKRSPKVFTVVVSGSTDATKAGCKSTDANDGVRQVRFNYLFTTEQSFAVSVQAGSMQFDFPVDINSESAAGLKLTDAASLLSVAFRKKPSDPWTTCGLNAASKVGILQRQH